MNRGLDVLWDDRDLRPGVRFNDAELLGYPIRITLGKFFFQEDQAELQVRKTGEAKKVEAGKDFQGLIQEVESIRNQLLAELKPED